MSDTQLAVKPKTLKDLIASPQNGFNRGFGLTR